MHRDYLNNFDEDLNTLPGNPCNLFVLTHSTKT
jgi:hypothetical protein